MSHMSTGSSGMSSPATMPEERHLSPAHYDVDESFVDESFAIPEEDPILKLTMGVVKTIKDLSDKVHKSKPNDYVDLVKVSKDGVQCWMGATGGAEESKLTIQEFIRGGGGGGGGGIPF